MTIEILYYETIREFWCSIVAMTFDDELQDIIFCGWSKYLSFKDIEQKPLWIKFGRDWFRDIRSQNKLIIIYRTNYSERQKLNKRKK